MNPDLLKTSGIDYEQGVKRFMGRANLYEKALSKFPKDTTFDRICISYEAGDREQLLSNVHEFKGMCGNISLVSLYETADAIVKILRDGNFPSPELSTAYSELVKEYHMVYEAVTADLED